MCHIGSMSNWFSWPQQNGADYKCPHCGAIYKTTITKMPVSERDSANCVKCGNILKSWSGSVSFTFELKKSDD